MTRHIKTLALITAVAVLAGCKLAVVVVEGGEVQSTASGTCLAETICIHEVTDTNYSESFTAVPDAGWRFVRWNNGGKFFCQNIAHPTCALSNVGAAGNAALEALFASDQTFYIMPVFERAADTILVDGREWYQPYLFGDLSANDIKSVCPGGVCNGALNGHDLAGWTWASVDDFNDLANFYIGSAELGGSGTTDFYHAGPLGATWITAFYNDGWRDTYLQDPPYHIVFGWLYDSEDVVTAIMGEVINASYAGTTLQDDPTGSLPILGAWFYRIP